MEWALPKPLQERLPAAELRLRLDIFDDLVLLHERRDGALRTRPVHPLDLVRALAGFPMVASGLLPDGTIWWGSGGAEGPQTALYRTARVWRVALLLQAFQPPEHFTIPMPPVVFLCRPGQPPGAWAVKSRPNGLTAQLYRLPAFNVFQDGRTCQGTVRYSDDVGKHVDEFFGTMFSPHAAVEVSRQHGNDIAALWRTLDGRRKYPLDDLVQWGTFKLAMERKAT